MGSLNFPATITRPDIAKSCSILSQFLRNPGPQHIEAADRAIRYLLGTKYLAIEFSGYPKDQGLLDIECYPFVCYSDAAFADHVDRKSSDGFLFTLYGGPIDWKASKQTTVTTSSTEAELLALSRTAKEVQAWQRFFKAINYQLDSRLSIHSDNTQTIRLLTSETPQLTTKLRHVDIHQHWLRQEIQEGRLNVEWVSTTDMKADGFTKPLTRQPFERFVRQLNLIDIQALLK